MCIKMVCVFCHLFFFQEKPKVRKMHLPRILLPKVQFSVLVLGLHLGQDTSGSSHRSGDCPREGAVQRVGIAPEDSSELALVLRSSPTDST